MAKEKLSAEAKAWMKRIPKRFYHGDEKPVAKTVGELIELLKQIPPELQLTLYRKGLQVIVYNISYPAGGPSPIHVGFDEDYDIDDEDEDDY